MFGLCLCVCVCVCAAEIQTEPKLKVPGEPGLTTCTVAVERESNPEYAGFLPESKQGENIRWPDFGGGAGVLHVTLAHWQRFIRPENGGHARRDLSNV